MALVVLHGTWDLLLKAIEMERLVLPGMSVAELGNILVYPDVFGHTFPAKKFWERFGATHVSFDLNGRDGALPVDLGQPLAPKYTNQHDLVTNFGCAEHVETSQYWCWRNIHNLCKRGGLMVNCGPEEGSWRIHCKIRYTVPWLEGLAEACGYDVRMLDRWENPIHPVPSASPFHSVRAIFRKTDKPFPTQEVFDAIER